MKKVRKGDLQSKRTREKTKNAKSHESEVIPTERASAKLPNTKLKDLNEQRPSVPTKSYSPTHRRDTQLILKYSPQPLTNKKIYNKSRAGGWEQTKNSRLVSSRDQDGKSFPDLSQTNITRNNTLNTRSSSQERNPITNSHTILMSLMSQLENPPKRKKKRTRSR